MLKNILNSTAVLLAFAYLIPKTASQLATLGPDIFSVAPYEFRGPLSSFDPPLNCQTIRTEEDDMGTISDDGTSKVYYSTHWGGCWKKIPESCCPPFWVGSGYYVSTGTACPRGYARMGASGLFFNLTSGTRTATPCCPIITLSFPEWSTSGTIFADMISLDSGFSGHTRRTARCEYGLSNNINRTATRNQNVFTVADLVYGEPLFFFEEASEATTTTTGGSPSAPTAQPGSTVAEAPRTTSDVPTDTEQPSGLRLPTPAAIGIGAGVGVSVIALAIFLIYYVAKRKMKKTLAAEPEWKDGKNSVASLVPGIIDYPGGIGGIQESQGEQRC